MLAVSLMVDEMTEEADFQRFEKLLDRLWQRNDHVGRSKARPASGSFVCPAAASFCAFVARVFISQAARS
jgi:hypothetical protein